MLPALLLTYTCAILIKTSYVAWQVSARDLRLSGVDGGGDEVIRYCISVRRPAGGSASLPGLVLLPVVSTSVSTEATEGYAEEADSNEATPAAYDDNPTESYYADQDTADYGSEELETAQSQDILKQLTEPHTAGRQVSSSTACTPVVATAQPQTPAPAPPPACFQRGKMPDPSSPRHYYSCIYDSQTRRFVANRVQCPNQLLFCAQRSICTFSTSCPLPAGKEAPSRIIRLGSHRT